MGTETKIEWCDHTFNPWIGCTRVGPGCDHCYAEADFDKRRRIAKWGAGNPRVRTSVANWRQPIKWDAKAKNLQAAWECGLEMVKGDEAELLRRGFIKPDRPRVFCASLSDWLDNEVPIEWLCDLLVTIANTPNLDWLLLTKRIGNWRTRIWGAIAHWEMTYSSSLASDEVVAAWSMAGAWLSQNNRPLPNVWIGATVVNQAEADRDVPKLLALPAAVRFLSIEPMLEPVTIFDMDGPIDVPDGDDSPLHWVIAGGESGAHARPSHPDWYRSLRDQCAAAGVPFLLKQWGEFAPADQTGHDLNYCYEHSKVGGWVDPDGKFQLGESATDSAFGAAHVFKIGKKATGRLLDGVEHNGYPTQ